MRRGGPGKASARRRVSWPSLEAAWEHFAGKAVFARWDKRVFADYVRHGFVPQAAHAPVAAGAVREGEAGQGRGGVMLAFTRENETRIYNTLPHDVPAVLLRHPLRCLVSYVAGKRSAENRQLGLDYVRRLAGPRWRWMEGSHLFPMERPEETAAVVLELLAARPGSA
jgi:hypothetical protein